jgi:hypothetical protein
MVGMSRRRIAIGILATMSALLMGIKGDGILAVSTAFAQTTPSTTTDPVASLLGQAAVFAGLAISVLNFLAWFLFYVLDILMDPQWIFDLKTSGADGSLMGMLREIWQLCRDLVNMAMAVLLVYEAMVMIVKADATKVKELLPKFVLALVAVNFSWFIPRAIFDASQVLTVTVYQIPNMIGMDGCTMPASAGSLARPCEIATSFAFFSDTDSMVSLGGGAFRNDADASTGWRCPLEKVLCVQMREYNTVTGISSRSKILNGLILNYARLRNLVYISDVRPPSGGPIGATGNAIFARSAGYLIKLFIAVILHIAIVFPLMAMVAGFAIRIPVLWITIALMPLVAIGTVMGDKLGEFNPVKLIWEQFLSAVFLPAKVALPFAISFVLLNAGSTATPPGSDAFASLSRPIAIFTEIRDLWQMLWMVIALGIIWKFSFDILKKAPFTEKIASGIEGMGKNLGGIAMKIPMSAPVIPWAGERTSISRIMRAGNLRDINTRLSTSDISDVLSSQQDILRGRPIGSSGGSGGTAASEAQVKTVRENININATNETTVKLLTATAGATDDAARQKQLMALLADARSRGGAGLNTIDNNRLLDALLRVHNTSINATQAQQLRKMLQASGQGSNNIINPS